MVARAALSTGRAAIDAVLDRVMREDAQRQAQKVATRFWSTLRRAARRIPFVEDVVAAFFCAFDPKVPFKARAVMLGALAYFVLPLDAVPDIIMLVGFGDDIAVLGAAIAAIRTNMTEEHYRKAREALGKSGIPDEDIRSTTGDREPTDMEMGNVNHAAKA